MHDVSRHACRWIAGRLATLAFFFAVAAAGSVAAQPTCEIRGDNWAETADACTALIASPGLSPRSYAEALFVRGYALSELGHLEEAVDDYSIVLDIAPDSPGVLINRGVLYFDLGEFASALTDYDRVLALQPDDAVAHNNRGNALRELNRHEEAIASFQEAIRLDPEYAFPFNGLAMTYMALADPPGRIEDYRQAVGHFDEAIRLSPDNPMLARNRTFALSGLARLLYDAGELDEALALAEDSVRGGSDQRQHFEVLAHILTALDRPDHGQEVFEHALRMGGALSVALYRTALVEHGFDPGPGDDFDGTMRSALRACLMAACRLLY